jgi:DNA-binding XRE family transcriptional regulator
MNEEVQNNVQKFRKAYTDILKEIISIRKSIPMTQAEVADWLKVDRRKIIALENGEINISLLLDYAEKLSIEINLYYTVT